MVPRFYEQHEEWSMPELSSNEVFGNAQEIQIEFCSGNGEWIARMAKENPQINFIAVEWQFKRVRKIWAKKMNLALHNLFIIYGKAEDYCDYYVKEGTFSKIFVNFPDPWPKLRHAKNRLLKTSFFDRLALLAASGCKTTVVTDDKMYTAQVLSEMGNSQGWHNVNETPFYRTNIDNYGNSYFNRLWQSMGREIHYIEFVKA